MRAFFYPWILFTSGAFAGPALVPIAGILAPDSSEYAAVMDVVILLWPVQLLGAWEASIGTFWAAGIAISANVVLFAVIGAIVVLCARWKPAFLIAAATIFVLVALYEYWIAGSNLAYLELRPLLTAIGLYGALLYGVYSLFVHLRSELLPEH